MNKNLFLPVFLSSCLIGIGSAFAQNDGDSSDIRPLPKSLFVQLDGGQVEAGPAKSAILNRFSAWYTDQILIQDRLDVRGGVGGLFWYSYNPGGLPSGAGYENVTNFGPGLSEVDATYKFGDLNHSPAFLQMGYFPYKYNPDAMDLGEYLLRSQAYPNVLVTGNGDGWDYMSEANYMMLGFRFNLSLWDGKFRSDFMLHMERDNAPEGDLSPTYVATLDPLPGIEIGVGADCSHCISVDPSKTTPKAAPSPNQQGNAYIEQNPNWTPADTLPGSPPRYVDTLPNGKAAGYYTFEGLKLEARASFDPKAYIPLPMLGKEDLKIFGEVAVLGVKDYPFYYTDIYQRMPIMFGINIPTFKLLDILSFQMEYFNSKFLNTNWNLIEYGTSVPIPEGVTADGVATDDPNQMIPDTRAIEAQKWHWAVYAKRQVIKGVSIYAQVACDHLRIPIYDGSFTNQEVTDGNGSNWYYLMRLEFGI